ncbi:MAG: GerMN domain-containing protein [Clostridia bacterium]|nr:GerMN domain-containing protein [Clostridia bacterium]
MRKDMKKKVITTSVFVLLLAAFITGIALYIKDDRSKARADVDMYFVNAAGTGIVAEQTVIKYRHDTELLSNTIRQLSRSSLDANRGRVIPRGTAVNNIELYDGGKIIVDFTDKFITDDAARNVLDTYAVVKTLCSTGLASTVYVTVNGSPVTDRDGNALGDISASDINLEGEEYSSEMRNIVLYFAAKDESGLVREGRTIKITDQQPTEQYIINELIKGTRDKAHHQSLISPKTVLMSVDIEDNICYLNFKSGFLSENTGTPEHDRLVIYSIVNSLTELESINRVQFYMDGKRVEHFGTVEIKDCISRDTTMISEIGEE